MENGLRYEEAPRRLKDVQREIDDLDPFKIGPGLSADDWSGRISKLLTEKHQLEGKD